MRILALDIGEKRIGLAVCDPQEKVASPVAVLPADEVINNSRTFKRQLEDWEPELLLCGLPVSMDGTRGKQAKRIEQVAKTISAQCGIPVEFADERLSSAQAKRSMRELGYDEASMRGKLDMVAACIFLQAWLDGRRDS